MVALDLHNTAFSHAVSFVNHSNQHIFLTGKAGTGKTTFLKYIRQHSHKKMAVAAPTGVAAMNAGGTTLHSLFMLPFGMYIAEYPLQWNENDYHIYNRKRLLGNVRFNQTRRQLLRELELLVIDEVSMLRSDLLDAIDAILRSVRRDARPFGGLQVLFIGDMYQLPPVVKESEWQIMQQHYNSPFFFDAHVLRENPPILLELKKIYRQSEQHFIDILNEIRNNCCTPETLERLNAYYRPDFVPENSDPYITLTSHNNRADSINRQALDELSGKSVTLRAQIRQDFPVSMYPAEEALVLKLGAQVMFIRNDVGEQRRYYNGKIGFVKHIDGAGDSLLVEFRDGSEDVEVNKEVWENIRYRYDKATDKVEEEVLGSFAQFPLRLAWAITIHKSQGLTFDKAIIDAGASFAAGQVYVALSRLRSLEGLVLKSKIPLHSIMTDEQVASFSTSILPEEEIPERLRTAQQAYLGHILLQTFTWDWLLQSCESIRDSIAGRNIAGKEEAEHFFKAICVACHSFKEVADKFKNQLKSLLSTVDFENIHIRTEKAVEWFSPRVKQQLIESLEEHIRDWSAKKRTKKYIEESKSLLLDFKRKEQQLTHSLSITRQLATESDLEGVMEEWVQLNAIPVMIEEEVLSSGKSVKGATRRISLDLFKNGKSIEEIAKQRELTTGTIVGHLIEFIGEEVKATDLVDTDKLEHMMSVLAKYPQAVSSELKAILGDAYSYADIRVAIKEKTLRIGT